MTLVVDNSHPESLVTQLPPSVRALVSPGKTVGLRVPGHEIILDVMRMLLPERNLLWHYRSQDERLINFSNAWGVDVRLNGLATS